VTALTASTGPSTRRAPAEAARDFTQAAIAHAGEYADNATVLVADLA
jgi:hypothetical protein